MFKPANPSESPTPSILPSGFLFITCAGGWLVFLISLALNHESQLSVVQGFALAAVVAGALVSLRAAFQLQVTGLDSPTVHYLFGAGFLIWSTAGFFWAQASLPFAYLTVTIYLLLTLQISAAGARPYALLAILSLWLTAVQVGPEAMIPPAVLLTINMFMAETILVRRETEVAMILNKLGQTQQELDESRRQQVSLNARQTVLGAEYRKLLQTNAPEKEPADALIEFLRHFSRPEAGVDIAALFLAYAPKIFNAGWAAAVDPGRIDEVQASPPTAADKAAALCQLHGPELAGRDVILGRDGADGAWLALTGAETPDSTLALLTGRPGDAAAWTTWEKWAADLIQSFLTGLAHFRANGAKTADGAIPTGLDAALVDLFRQRSVEGICHATAEHVSALLRSPRVEVRLYPETEI